MDENADLLVARPCIAEVLRLGRDSTVRLGDRTASIVETEERLEDLARDPRGCGRHP
jgi:hypothetical protein